MAVSSRIIRGLCDSEYHYSKEYSGNLSSTQLKDYLVSPKYALYMREHPDETKPGCLATGSLFHSLMQRLAECRGDREKAEKMWHDSIAVFQPPLNEKTGKPVGSAAKSYLEAYATFLEESSGKTVATQSDVDLCMAMVDSLLSRCGTTSRQVCRLLKWAKSVEDSYFMTDENDIGLKVRPDMLTANKLIDWKSCCLESLDEDSLTRHIIRYRYDISLSMYQYVLHSISGKWYDPYLVFVSKVPPFDCVICDMSEWCYHYDKELDVAAAGVGALEFRRLLDLHTQCVKSGEFPGIECTLSENENKVMRPSVPYWFGKRYYEL